MGEESAHPYESERLVLGIAPEVAGGLVDLMTQMHQYCREHIDMDPLEIGVDALVERAMAGEYEKNSNKTVQLLLASLRLGLGSHQEMAAQIIQDSPLLSAEDRSLLNVTYEELRTAPARTTENTELRAAAKIDQSTSAPTRAALYAMCFAATSSRRTPAFAEPLVRILNLRIRKRTDRTRTGGTLLF